MKIINPYVPAIDRRLTHQDRHEPRTLWFADGRTLAAKVTKVEKDGIQISTSETSEFINASDLCTADRVRYGLGTRKEELWAAQMVDQAAKVKKSREPQDERP